MKTMRSMLLATVAFMIGMAAAMAARPSGPSAVNLKGDEIPQQLQAAYTKAIAVLVPELTKADGRAVDQLEATVHQAARPGAEAERTACCQAILTALQGDAVTEAKVWLIKQLQNIGRAEVVPLLAKLLADKDGWLRETARMALQNNPTPEAAAALRAMLNQVNDPKGQGALALALGARKDAASVSVIAGLLKQRDDQVVAAALKALGDIGAADAADAIANVRKTLPEKLQIISAEAWMKCAEQMLRAGRMAQAMAIYTQLNDPAEPRPVRLAALKGTLQCGGDGAGKTILELLGGNDSDAREIATAQISELSSGAVKNLVAGAGKLPAEGQIMIIGLLASRGEKAALPLALELARGQEDRARLAGINALGRLGDTTTVPLLVENLSADGEVANEARASLTRITGVGANESLVTAFKQAGDTKRKTTLIEILEGRGATVAVPVLLAEATGDNKDLRRPAMKALGRLAAPNDLPTMLKGLYKCTAGGERDEAEKAITAICTRIPDKSRQADPILDAYRRAAPAEKNLLIPILGRIGGNKAFEVIKSALAADDAATVDAGQAALYNWPDATDEVADQLLAMVKGAQKPAEKQVALRAYIRVASLPDGLPEKARFDRLQKAMELADRDQERNFVLERLQDVKRIETIRFAASFLDQPALNARAGATIVELARDRGLKDRNKAEFEQVLNKIIATAKDQALIDRAKRRLGDR